MKINLIDGKNPTRKWILEIDNQTNQIIEMKEVKVEDKPNNNT